MLAAMAELGLDVAPEPCPVDANSPIDAILDYCAEAEAGYGAMFEAWEASSPAAKGVTSEIEVITGVDGNEIKLYIERPTNADGALPAIVHMHGGGMVILTAADPLYKRLRKDYAAMSTGLACVTSAGS